MSGVTPPHHPLAEFPDHPYISGGEDVIRPKPRRLVDMRRPVVQCSDPSPQYSPSSRSSSHHSSPGMVSSSPSKLAGSQLPPMLPTKPFRECVDNNVGQFENNRFHPIGKTDALLKEEVMLTRPVTSINSQRESPLYMPMGQNQHNQYVSPSTNLSPKRKGFSLRSVPNLPQLLYPISSNNMYTPTPTPLHQQPAKMSNNRNGPVRPNPNLQQYQRRRFLSPQPMDNKVASPMSSAALRGSSGNLLDNDHDATGSSYYSELTNNNDTSSPPNNTSSFAIPHPRMGNHPSYVPGPPKPPFPRSTEGKITDNFQKQTDLKFRTVEIGLNEQEGQMARNNIAERLKFFSSTTRIPPPEQSPEYDRIKSPSELVQEMKQRFDKHNESGQYVEPDPPRKTFPSADIGETSSPFVSPNGHDAENSIEPTTPYENFGKLERSVSPTDLQELYVNNEVQNKGKVSTPTSKLKSRRKNILHNLSAEEMLLLNSGTNPPTFSSNSNNTGTGGSTSDGSSGHASMSESQTSSSPPAEYATISSTGFSNGIYKSSLKSVPEDELGNCGDSGRGTGRGSIGNTTRNSTERNKGLDASPSSGSKKSSRSRQKNKQEPVLLCSGNSGLEDIKQAIEQLTLRSNHGGGGGHHSSYSTSTYSSRSGSECDRHKRSHHIRYSSLDTINTQVTCADEFVWVDSHNRLVELQYVPWSNHDILKVIEKSSRLKTNLERISMESVPRVSYLLQRALVRIGREAQRLTKPCGFCSKQEIASALRIVLSPALADSCSKACLRAAAMFAGSTSNPLHRDSKSSRAGLNLHVGRFHRWMVDVRLGRFVHDFAAVHLTAAIENLIEEILGQALSHSSEGPSQTRSTSPILTAALLDQTISSNGDLWGLLQPYAHLNAGRVASGALALPRRWASAVSVDSSSSSSSTIGPSLHDDSSLSGRTHHNHNKSLEQSLLTTCVGSVGELADILSLVSKVHYKQLPLSTTNNGSKATAPAWSPTAVQTLFYFMRCSQLENSEDHLESTSNLGSSTVTLGPEGIENKPKHHGQSSRPAVQELVYERPFIVLPPLIEWVRVSSAHADHRHSGMVDKDDVMQAARLLLPGIDCPVRVIGNDEFSWPRRSLDEFECNRRLKVDLAFKMLTSGRSDLVAQALLLMPSSKSNTFNELGLCPLILACIRREESMMKVLLEAGADPDAETPANGPNFPQANSEIQHWTALTFAALVGHLGIVKILLERNSNIEGGAKLDEHSTQTPLQVASAIGNIDIVSILLAYGANPFLSTLVKDPLCYTGSAQRGSFSAISVAASHGQRTVVHKLVSHPVNQPSSKEVLSLEEILAEGAPQPSGARNHQQVGSSPNRSDDPKVFSKTQLKVLQEAMYQSSEHGHLEITLDLRSLGVPWTLQCWVNSMATSCELRSEGIMDQLLEDFLQMLQLEDFSQTSFVEDCVPLLFTIFRNSKNERTALLLAEVFQTCYGRDQIKDIRDTSISNGTRIDPKYVNNPELSDVQFRVDGRVFYAHKIVLVTSSQRFKSMLKNATDSVPPVIAINDIRYPVFQMVMEYLYNGNADCIRHIESDDVLELMAAASFFQLDGLLRFCEARCSQTLTMDSIVSNYIHAKVYNAIQLLEYCQGFLLQNMVTLLTYDDSTRKLIFGKKLHNHDVLAGLLLTLQARLKSRPNNVTTRKSK